MTVTTEYALIKNFYGERTAKRSGVPLINHINEGMVIMDRRGASDAAKRAFCLHPLFQNDADLKEHGSVIPVSFGQVLHPRSILLTMEYRNIANQFLSGAMYEGPDDMGRHVITPGHPVALSPLEEVNEMLVADKVQNRKDFIRYHKGKHEKSDRLDAYFLVWMDRLGITDAEYERLTEGL